MSIVDEIKSPMDNNEFLKSLILLYAKQTLENRKSGSYIYDELIRYPQSEADADKSKYGKLFKKYVEQDTICQLLVDVLGYSKEDSIRLYMDLFLDGNDEDKPGYIDKGELVSMLEDARLLDIHYDEKYMQMKTCDILKSVFHVDGTMGYHIYKSKFGNVWDSSDSMTKLYINAGEDTYEFSKLFKQKCEEHGLSYAYKVVNPDNDEENRADKMCIYMGLNDVEEYIKIVKELRLEHPDFDYRKPSPLMGSIDDWIGVGADPDNFELARSYSESRAQLIENSLRAVFKNASEKKIKKMLDNNSDHLVEKLRFEIKQRAALYSITKHFVFDDVIMDALDKPAKERLDEYYKNRNKLFNNLPSSESKQTLFQKVKGLLSKIRKKSNEKSVPSRSKTTFWPDKQDFYPGVEVKEDSDYKARLQIDLDKMGQMPIRQDPINNEIKGENSNMDLDHDDSDVWL